MRRVSFLLLAGVFACGGTTDVGDGGIPDSSNNNDVNNGNDGGNPSDAGNNDTGLAETGTDGGNPDAGPFDPSQLSDLVLWLDAAKGVTSGMTGVSAWADQTTYHNDASGTAGATGAHEPTLTMNAINSLPAISFAPGMTPGSSEFLDIADSASLEFATGDWCIFMVAQYSNPTTGNGAGQAAFYAKIAGNTTPTGPQLIGNAATGTSNTLTGNIRARINATDNVNSAGTTYNDGMYHRIGIRKNGTLRLVCSQPEASGSFN
jgi:hypothetical protein